MCPRSSKVIYIMKDALHVYPPCISQIVMLRKLDFEVYVITEECDENSLSVIKNVGANVKILGNLKPKTKSILARIYHWLAFKKYTIKELKRTYRNGDIIWFGTERTGFVINNYTKNKKTVLNVLELYDRLPTFKYAIKRIITDANAVVACEKNRARIMKQWYNLDEIPYVMPNKPSYDITCNKSDDVCIFEKKIDGRKYILYQGILNAERPLDNFLQALNLTKEKYTFVIIGQTSNIEAEKEMMNHMTSIYPNVIYGGFFPAPQHLYITQNAYIGVAIYDASSINTMFCAPNKTFEYSKYNIPILGSDVPGLQLTVEKCGAGICVDIDNPKEIAKAIDDIADNYDQYQLGAKKLYDSVDNIETMKKIVKKLDLDN